MEKVYTLDKKMSKQEIKDFMDFVSITADEARKKTETSSKKRTAFSKNKKFKFIETPDIVTV